MANWNRLLAVALVACATAASGAAEPEAPKRRSRADPPVFTIRGLPDERGPGTGTLPERLCRAEGRVTLAREEVYRARGAYARMRRQDYPRGEARELIKQWRIRALAELADAEQDFHLLREEADWELDVEDALASCPTLARAGEEAP